jgi:signal transduction histidine kinase
MTERKHNERELVSCAEQLRALAQRLAEVREDERRRLAQELHDRVGQNLTALDLNLAVIRSALPPETFSRVGERLADCLGLVEHTAEIVSDMMTELRPVVVDDLALMAALRREGKQFSLRTGVPVQLRGQEPAPRLTSAVRNALFRIAQEALTNVAKYARGSQVDLTLDSSVEHVRMILADDGCGFDPSLISSCTGRRGWGLRIMRERAEAVGGRFQIQSLLGEGTRVTVEVRR